MYKLTTIGRKKKIWRTNEDQLVCMRLYALFANIQLKYRRLGRWMAWSPLRSESILNPCKNEAWNFWTTENSPRNRPSIIDWVHYHWQFNCWGQKSDDRVIVTLSSSKINDWVPPISTTHCMQRMLVENDNMVQSNLEKQPENPDKERLNSVLAKDLGQQWRKLWC